MPVGKPIERARNGEWPAILRALIENDHSLTEGFDDTDGNGEEDDDSLQPTQIVLDFSSFWERGTNRGQSGLERWTRFWEVRREALDLQHASDPRAAFEQWVGRVWPSGVPGSMIAANVTLEGPHPRWMLRPPITGPRAATYAAGEFAPALIAYRRQGRLAVCDFDYVPHMSLRPHERAVSGPIFHNVSGLWSADVYMEAEDLEALANLPRRRERTNQQLELWQQYLVWKEKLVRSQQLTYRFNRFEVREEGTVLAFVLEGTHEVPTLVKRLRGSELLIAPRESSRNPEKWDPTPKAESRLKTVGEVIGVRALESEGQRKGKEASKPRQAEPGIERQESRLPVIATEVELLITPDEEDPARLEDFLERLPETGWLLSPLAGELAPIQNQRKGIERLRDGKTFANNLGDWLFSVEHARPPLSFSDVFLTREPLARLNQEQRSAVNKALAAPDVCLLQGPPGTGKTTVIAEICFQTALNGGRTLVASQTNLAVDNALSRLANRPEMRPLRIGQPDRVGDEYQEFLEDNVVERWFKGIRRDCAERSRRRDGLEKRLRDAREALRGLELLLESYQAKQQELARAAEAGEKLRRQQDLLLQERLTLGEARELERQRLQSLEAFERWLTDGTETPPPAKPLERTSTARAIGELSATLASSLEGLELPWNFRPYLRASWLAGAFTGLDGLRHVVAILPALEAPLGEAAALCRGGTGGSAHDARRLTELSDEKMRLVDSDDEDDLRRLRQINSELKRLKEGRWSEITGSLRRLLRPHLEHMDDVLEHALAALRPDPSFSPVLDRIVADHQRLTKALIELHPKLELLAGEAKQDHEKAREALEQQDVRFAEFDARREALAGEGEALGHRAADLSAERDRLGLDWRRLWGQASPEEGEVDASTGSSSPSPAALQARRMAVDGFATQHRASMDRHQRWREIQDEWLERLNKPSESDRERLKDLYVRHCNVVGLTCHEAGRWQFWDKADFSPFDVVIVDEVSKATPPELILPMLLGRKVILVGDHRQLPPMFKERESSFRDAVEEGEVTQEDFERFEKMVTASLFQTLFEQAGDAIRHALYVQYRMHPTIMEAINQFYEHRLQAGPTPERLDQLRQHRLRIEDLQGAPLLAPGQHLLWIDSSRDERARDSFEEQHGSSKAHELEVRLARALLIRLNDALSAQGYGPQRKGKATQAEAGLTVEAWTRLLLTHPAEDTIHDLFQLERVWHNGRLAHRDEQIREGDELIIDGRKPVGLITFYGAQLRALRTMRDGLRGEAENALSAIDLRINTVDRFQGMERPILIVSLVRAQRHFRGGDFVRQFQRINVALSRAQELLVILGAERTFAQATVELPPLAGGEPIPVPAYRNIWDQVKLVGGRRYASQLLE